MIGFKTLAVTAMTAFCVAACGNDKVETADTADVTPVEIDKTAPTVSFKPGSDSYDGTVAKPGAPYSISYRIIGTPIVGRPTTVDLRVTSALGPRPVTLDYRINDASAMTLAQAQPNSVLMKPAANESTMLQQVTLIPLRDGRQYLNVSASFETETGTMSTIAAIPIQVGNGTRELTDNGELEVDENGETVRVLSPD